MTWKSFPHYWSFVCGSLGAHLQPRGTVLYCFFMATTEDVWIILSFEIWGYVLHSEHVSCVITKCGQHQWVIPSISTTLWALLEENINRKLLSLSLDLFFKILLFQAAFLVFFSIANLSPYFLLVGFLLQYGALFHSGHQLNISVILNWCRVAVSNEELT